MSSLNRVELIGRLGQDPQSKSFQDGGKIVNMRIATSESWKDRQSGERKERTEWHSVVVSKPGLVDNVMRYLRKGARIYVTGKLTTRKWQDQSGADRYSTEIVVNGYAADIIFLDGQRADGSQDRAPPPEQNGGYQSDLDDDVPF